MGRLRTALTTTAATLAALAGATGAAQAADGLYGLTSDQTLLRISSADPGSAQRVAISGLPIGVRLTAIDTHPETGALFAVAGGGERLFQIDPTTGAATEQARPGSYFSEAGTVAMAISPFASGTTPMLQLSAGDWLIVGTVGYQAGSAGYSTGYVPGDSGDGVEPDLTGLANDLRSSSWRLLGIDHRRNAVARITATGTPNAARGLATIGSLGVDVPAELGFAPAASGELYLAYQQTVRGFTQAESVLRRVDRLTGATTLVGAIRAAAYRTPAGEPVDVIGLAAARSTRM